MPRRPTIIDESPAGVTGPQRAALARLRMTIRAALPEAEECISYGMHAFRAQGRVVAGFAATAGVGSYYPFSGTTLATLAGDLEGRDRTKSALHFDAAGPLPSVEQPHGTRSDDHR